MPLYRLDLEYLGTRYRGWQSQKNAPGVANAVEKACRSAFKDVKQLLGAGRTDAGVHALQQVAHLRCASLAGPPGKWLAALNDALPPDIAATRISPAEEGFDARRSAIARVYLYQVLRRRSAFGADLAWWVKDRLDAAAMRAAVPHLLGRHDFSAFSDLDPERPRETSLDLAAIELAEDGPLLLLRFRARSFIWKMVRRLSGYLVEVGRGRFQPGLTPAMFKQDRKVLAPFTAPPQGLFLERVVYPGESFSEPLRGVLRLPR